MVLWDGGEKEDNNNQERGLHLVWPAGFIVSSRSPPLLNVPADTGYFAQPNVFLDSNRCHYRFTI